MALTTANSFLQKLISVHHFNYSVLLTYSLVRQCRYVPFQSAKSIFFYRETRRTPVLRLDPTLPEQLMPFLRLYHQTPPLYMTSPPLEKCSISIYKIKSFLESGTALVLLLEPSLRVQLDLFSDCDTCSTHSFDPSPTF